MVEISYQVRIVVTWPDGAPFEEPTNTTIEFAVAAAIEDQITSELPRSETRGLGVTVRSERLDK